MSLDPQARTQALPESPCRSLFWFQWTIRELTQTNAVAIARTRGAMAHHQRRAFE